MARESGTGETYVRLKAYKSDLGGKFIQIDFGPDTGEGRVESREGRCRTAIKGQSNNSTSGTVSIRLLHSGGAGNSV